MKLPDAYDKVRGSIVAIVASYKPVRSEAEAKSTFPPVIGTGLIVDEGGLIVTNEHVVNYALKLWRSTADECPFNIVVFKDTEKGLLQFSLDVDGIYRISKMAPGGIHYGPPRPDIAFIQVVAKDLPAADLDDASIREGSEVATAGFPLGREALTAPGWLQQIGPTLQRGIISAVLPFHNCSVFHAFTINIMAQGGVSGSPVFSPETGKVIGLLYAGLSDVVEASQDTQYNIPTNISYVVPSHYIVDSLATESIRNRDIPEGMKALDKLIQEGMPGFEEVKGTVSTDPPIVNRVFEQQAMPHTKEEPPKPK